MDFQWKAPLYLFQQYENIQERNMARIAGETPGKQLGGAVTRRKPESLRQQQQKNLYYYNFCSTSSVLNLGLRECTKKYI